MRASRGERVGRALEAVENARGPSADRDREGLVVFVTADLTSGHDYSPEVRQEAGMRVAEHGCYARHPRSAMERVPRAIQPRAPCLARQRRAGASRGAPPC